MKLIATENFKPVGVYRLVRPGEEIVVDAKTGRKWIAQGFALPLAKAAPELAIRRPRENR